MSTEVAGVSVVIPCYRSASTLPELVRQLLPILRRSTAAHEVILVVDGSPDGTWEVARELARAHRSIEAVRLSRNYGQHNALIAGIRLASHDVVVTMDDDLQHPPDQIPTLLAAMTDDFDLVYGVPVEEEHGWLRSLASRSVKAGMSRGLRIEGAQDISAFRVFRTYLREAFDDLSGPHASLDVALSWATSRATSVVVRMQQRMSGESNYTGKLLVRHALNMLLGYSTAPLRLVVYMGLFCSVVGLSLLAYILFKFATGMTTVPGFTTVASMVAIFSGAQMLGIGVMGEYIGRIHSRNLGRPTYLIRERVGTERRVIRSVESGAPSRASRPA